MTDPAPADPAEVPPTPREGTMTEWLLRAIAALFYALAIHNLGRAWWVDQSRWTVLLLLIAETYTLLLVIFARKAIARDVSPLAIVTTMYALLYFTLLQASGTTRIVPEMVGVAVQTLALGFTVFGKMTLGRSFGLLPARRKVVLGGPYRLVRHPIYFGYLVINLSFLLVNFNWWNAGVVALVILCQAYRIQREELFLSQTVEYREYQSQVRWRYVPFVW